MAPKLKTQSKSGDFFQFCDVKKLLFFPTNLQNYSYLQPKKTIPNFSCKQKQQNLSQKEKVVMWQLFLEKTNWLFWKRKENLHQDDEKQRLKIHYKKKTLLVKPQNNATKQTSVQSPKCYMH